jgi:hypothetical protein
MHKRFLVLGVFTAAIGLLGLSLAQGEIILEQEINPAPADGLISVTVSAVGTAGEVINGFAGINLSPPTHNVTPFAVAGGMTHAGNWAAPGVFGSAEWAKYDTHVLIDLSNTDHVVGALGDPLAEDSDNSDPAGLGPLAMTGFEAFPATVGVGAFGLQDAGDQFVITPAISGSNVPFLQVVFPRGAEGLPVLLDVTLFDDQGTAAPFVDVEIIPEPSTFAVLGIALIGLGAFLRKR